MKNLKPEWRIVLKGLERYHHENVIQVILFCWLIGPGKDERREVPHKTLWPWETRFGNRVPGDI